MCQCQAEPPHASSNRLPVMVFRRRVVSKQATSRTSVFQHRGLVLTGAWGQGWTESVHLHRSDQESIRRAPRAPQSARPRAPCVRLFNPTLRQTWPRERPGAAMCVQGIDVQCVLQFTLINAAGCALHRCTSQVIHRSELYFWIHGHLLGRPAYARISLVTVLPGGGPRQSRRQANDIALRTGQTWVQRGCHQNLAI